MALRRAASVLTTRALRAATATPAALAMAQPLRPARFASSDERIKAPATPNPTMGENATPPPPLQTFEEIQRLTEEAHRHATAVTDGAKEVDTARNAVSVAMLQRTVSTELLTAARENQATVLRAVVQLCTLSHTKASLEALIEVLLVLNPAMDSTDKSDWTTHYESPYQWECEFPTKRGDRFRRRFLLAWCRLRLFDPTLPDTKAEQAVRHELLCLLNDNGHNASFLVNAVGRDEFFLRFARRQIDCRVGVLHSRFQTCISGHDLDVFATAEFFDEFFLKFAWLQSSALSTVIAGCSAERCRAVLATAFRDAYFPATLETFDGCDMEWFSITGEKTTARAIVCCREFTCAAAEKGIRFPCTATLRDFFTSLISEVFEIKDYRRDKHIEKALCEFEKILREGTDFAVLRTAEFRDSFFLKVAGVLDHCAAMQAVRARILARVIRNASPAEIEVFATEEFRDRLIVPIARSVPVLRYMHKQDDDYPQDVEFRTAFFAAFNAIARTEDGSLKAVFDTEAVRSKVLPLLAEEST